MSNQRSRTGALLLVAAAVLVASIFWLGQPPTATAADEMPADPPFMVNPYHIADVAEKVTPSVVYIEVTWPAQQRARSPFNDPFFREFFPFNPWPDASPQTSRGTGFIIDQEGHILT